jgi:two-component system, response regulator PdtaR
MRKTVLLVQDEFLVAMDLELLERRGWRVLGPATIVKEALDLVGDELPAVALLDVTLKHRAMSERLRARNGPFVVAIAYSTRELIGGQVLAGAPMSANPPRSAACSQHRSSSLHPDTAFLRGKSKRPAG